MRQLGSRDAQQLTEVRCAGALVGLTLIAFATRLGSLPLQRSELPLLAALGISGLALVQWSYVESAASGRRRPAAAALAVVTYADYILLVRRRAPI